MRDSDKLKVPPDKFKVAIIDTAAFLDGLANTLDRWAIQSRGGGWSTHQVDANMAAANDCRRQAAILRTSANQ